MLARSQSGSLRVSNVYCAYYLRGDLSQTATNLLPFLLLVLKWRKDRGQEFSGHSMGYQRGGLERTNYVEHPEPSSSPDSAVGWQAPSLFQSFLQSQQCQILPFALLTRIKKHFNRHVLSERDSRESHK